MTRTRRRAWVAWSPVSGTYSGYVAELDEDGGELGKDADAPDGLCFEDIVRWATERAANVFVRPHWDSGTTYWTGDGDHTDHPLLDPGRAVEPAGRIGHGDGDVTIAGVVANCADCNWHGTFANEAALLGAYAAHAQDAHGGRLQP